MFIGTQVKEKKLFHGYYDTQLKKKIMFIKTNKHNKYDYFMFLGTHTSTKKAISCLLGHTVIVKKLFLLFPLHASFRYFMNSSFIKENVL